MYIRCKYIYTCLQKENICITVDSVKNDGYNIFNYFVIATLYKDPHNRPYNITTL